MSIEVLDYVGLNINNIPNELTNEKPVFKIAKTYDNSGLYKIYKNISIKDLQILISDTDRTTDIKERYERAKPLDSFIKEDTEQFIGLAEKSTILEIERIEALQNKLKDEIPFFIKYDKNYLWQIYYSNDEDKYFVIFPAKEDEVSVLFYLIKKKLEKEDTTIFVPICQADYNERLLSKKETVDLENYIWQFTKNWPITYEVTRENPEIYIVGKAKIYNSFSTKYKISLKTRQDVLNTYMLFKALFILDTEANYKEIIETEIDENGELTFYCNGKNINIGNLSEFISAEVRKKENEKKDIFEKINVTNQSLNELKDEIAKGNDLYLKQEKQIVLFLECKKSFFKKITYFFKSSKKLTANNGKHLSFEKKQEDDKHSHLKSNKNEKQEEIKDNSNSQEHNEVNIDSYKSYTLADLIKICNQTASTEGILKNVEADYKVFELKNKNLKTKIENAKQYITEIEKHKKSIFEFWKFSNKDELTALQEGEEQKTEKEATKLKTTFNLDEDMTEFGEKVDELQKRKLSTDECNAVFICKYLLDSVNAVIKEKDENISREEKEQLDKIIKKQFEELKKNASNDVETQIFGELVDDYTQIKMLKDKQHRESKKNIYSILKINKNMTIEEYKNILLHFIKLLDEAYHKINSITDMPIYFKEKPKDNMYMLGEINPSNIIKPDAQNIYKTQISEEKNILYYSNIIFYDNFNKTLPSGMDESSQVLIFCSGNQKEMSEEKEINILEEKNPFEVKVRKIKIATMGTESNWLQSTNG